jgi:dienelactone hydrolase
VKLIVSILSFVLLFTACSTTPEAQTTYQRLDSQTKALPCPGDDDQIQRYLVTKSRTELGSITASACGYPDSEYGAITIIAMSKDSEQSEILLTEEDNFWIGNESRFVSTETGWELSGLIGNGFDGDEGLLKVSKVNGKWTGVIEGLPKPHPVSLQSLMKTELDGRNLKLVRQVSATSSYKRYAVTYKSGDLTISGIMNIPNGEGPFPTLVLGHGYIDPAIYTSGRGLAREQDYLARNGYIVLHSDYRNHAGSDDDPENNIRFRMGYVLDIVNAALALRAADIPQIDDSRIGYLGRSMGGGIGYQAMVAFPNVFDSYVLYAPTSADYADNFNRWGRVATDFAQEVSDTYGLPEDNPEFWANISAVNFFDQVNEPVLIHHGTLDDSCNIEWSRRAATELKAQGKDVELIEYVGEYHAFYRDWTLSMQRTVKFFERTLN